MEPISIIFASANAGKSIAEYLGLVESIHSDIKALLHQSFNSAKINLEYAKDATSENQRDYSLQAKNDFIKAIHVEKGTDLVTSYLGLAMCQYLLGDIQNSRKTLWKIVSVKLPKGERNKAIALDVSLPTSWFEVPSPFGRAVIKGVKRLFGEKGNFELSAEQELERYKTECLKCLELKQLNNNSYHNKFRVS